MDKDLFKSEIIESEEGILEVSGLPAGEYDKQAVKYDRLISNGWYNRIMWGNSPKDYTRFCEEAIDAQNRGIIADIGCGTLSFTSKVYAKHQKQNLFLCDLSLEMLKIGRQRILSDNGELSKITFLRSNALEMPFKNQTIQAVLSFGFFHVVDDPYALLNEFKRILKPGGKIYLTSLCADRKFSAKYLDLLHRKGHVAKPLRSREIIKIIEKCGFSLEKNIRKGGMIYIIAHT